MLKIQQLVRTNTATKAGNQNKFRKIMTQFSKYYTMETKFNNMTEGKF